MYSKFVFSFLFTIFISSNDQALAYSPKEGKVTLGIGGVRSQMRSFKYDGFVIQATGDLNFSSSLLLDMIFIEKSYARDERGSFLHEKIEMVEFDMGYKRWLNGRFSVSLSIASLYRIGDVKIMEDHRPSSEVWTTSAYDPTHYGISMGVQYEFMSEAPWAPSLDLRYFYSLNKKSGETADQFSAAFLFRFPIQ